MNLLQPAYGTGSLAELLPSVSAVLGVPGAVDSLGLGSSSPADAGSSPGLGSSPADAASGLGSPGRAAGLDGVDRVAVLLVDGLGSYQLPLARPHAPVLGQLAGRTITAGFPSTTPVSLATLGTGTPPGAHGILGFTVRQPSGEVLNHIQWGKHPDPRTWQPVPTRFELARAAGVGATLVTKASFRGTGLTTACYRGADFVGANDADALVTGMLSALERPGLVYGYHPDLDHHGHGSGVGSPEWISAVQGLDRLLSRLLTGLPARTALLVTADHGQLNIPAEGRLDLAAAPELSAGIVGVSGEPRVRYLYAAPGAVPDVLAAYGAHLGSSALVLTRDEAVEMGLYGAVPPDHRARIGDVVVICLADNVVLAGGWEPASVGTLVAYHGSLTPAEMAVPLLSYVTSV